MADHRRANFCVGKDSCNSQTTKDSSDSTLLAAILFGAGLYHRLSIKTLSPAKGRKVQLSFEWSCPCTIKSDEKMYQNMHESVGTSLHILHKAVDAYSSQTL